MKLTENRKYTLANAIFTAYQSGWNGSLQERKTRPRIDSWRNRSSNGPACKAFQAEGMAHPLKGEYYAEYFLTRKGVKLAEEIYKSLHGKDAKTAAADYNAQVKADEEERQAKVKRATHLFRGIKLKEPWFERRARSVSAAIRDKRLEDGFKLTLTLDQLLELGEQIERLR